MRLSSGVSAACRPLHTVIGFMISGIFQLAIQSFLSIRAKGYFMKNSNMLTGLFRDRDSAERAYQSVAERGYDKKDVNVVMSDETRKRHFSGGQQAETELGSKAAEGASIGGAVGGTLGAIAAAIAAVGTSIAIPGLGVVIAGPLAAAIAG